MLTGKLGDVMRSAQAMSFVRSRAEEFIAKDFNRKLDVRTHPEARFRRTARRPASRWRRR